MREMVGGCCVCSDERGWTENPLVYCDGHGCAVAVHQACYGIVSVPTGPWFCRKCESQERAARVRCELCPQREGALKRTDTGGWCHVVCALFIPEAWFGNVQTMEPIILKGVPPERFNKSCYVCEEQGREGKATTGACMQCNKNGCKQHFHVTCAQGQGQLCEEAGSYMDNVKYCGYCSYHYKKLKKDSHIKTIPAFKPIVPENLTPDGTPEKRGDKPRLKHGPGLSLGASLSRDKGGGGHKSIASAALATLSAAPSSGSGSTPSSPEPTLSSIAAAYQREREQKEREKAQQAVSSPEKELPPDAADSGDSNPSSAKSITDITSTGKFTTANFTETTITPSPATFDFGSPNSDNGKPEGKPHSDVKEKPPKEKEKSSKSKKAEKKEKAAADSGLSSSVGSDSGETDKSSAASGSTPSIPVSLKRGVSPLLSGGTKSSGSSNATPSGKTATSAASSSQQASTKNTPTTANSSSSSTSSSKPTNSFSYSYENFLSSNYSSPNLPPPPVEKAEKESERSTTPLSSPPELEPVPGKRQRSRSGEKGEKKKSKKIKQEKNPKAKTVKDLLATKDSPTWGTGSPPSSPTRPTPSTTSGKKGNKKKNKDPTSPLAGSLSPSFASPYTQNSGGTTAITVSSLQKHERDNPTENAASASSFFPDNISNTSTGPSQDMDTSNGPTLVGPPKPGSGKSGLLSPSKGSSVLGGGDTHSTNQLPTSMEQLLERQWDQGSQFLMEQGQHFDIASLLNCLHQLRQENQRLEEHIATLTARRDQLLAVNARLSLPLTPLNNPHPGAGASHPGASGVTPPETGGGHHRSPRVNNLLPQDTPSSAAQDSNPNNRNTTRSPAHGQSPAQNHLPPANTQSPGSQTGTPHNSRFVTAEGLTSGPPSATTAPGIIPASSQGGNTPISEQQRLHQLLLNAQLTPDQYQQLVYQSLQHHSVAAAGLQPPPGTPSSLPNSSSHPAQRGGQSSTPHTPLRGGQGPGYTPQRSTPGKSPGDKSKEKT